MSEHKDVILSTALLLEEGTFTMEEINLEDAKIFASFAKNFVGHSTVRVLGIEPATSREVCEGYDRALVLKVQGRVEFGKEYTVEEILEIGVRFYLIQNYTERVEIMRLLASDLKEEVFCLTVGSKG